jgi:hypothetical protein
MAANDNAADLRNAQGKFQSCQEVCILLGRLIGQIAVD